MSRSKKARHSTRSKQWKDSAGTSRSQAQSRAKWKKAKRNTKNPTYGSGLRRNKPQPRPRQSNTEAQYYHWQGANTQRIPLDEVVNTLDDIVAEEACAGRFIYATPERY